MNMRLDQPAAAQAPLGVIGRRIADEVWLKRRDAAFRKADVGRGVGSAGKACVADHVINHCKNSRGVNGKRNKESPLRYAALAGRSAAMTVSGLSTSSSALCDSQAGSN